jgi:uncharacterized protein (UPF0335 family)
MSREPLHAVPNQPLLVGFINRFAAQRERVKRETKALNDIVKDAEDAGIDQWVVKVLHKIRSGDQALWQERVLALMDGMVDIQFLREVPELNYVQMSLSLETPAA